MRERVCAHDGLVGLNENAGDAAHEARGADDLLRGDIGVYAEDVAPLAVFLSGKGSDYITGQLIAVDGGFTTTAVWPVEV